ncbi:aminoacyl-histidine dipeptidase [Lutimonas zeaxanthinifaciens]|uniref:aminoacyl-histidine dipeptidase n=1 Tax=Lutimonas zeaxanthinifaciens TaxID=3060215 RepID=UPI00265D1122|nr:aminoacyl-histidine dipeptidase [Lutimonas sp. YSD2104]WKK65183.1 aminoacyl-histidine dipeptidase [Lutimonas sp. YSD2104]
MSNTEIRNQEPKTLWNHFADINAIPRASKKEERIIEFMSNFGKNLGLETIVDPVGNVIIRKPATKGMENRKTVVLQSHLDMVHQKNTETDFDFNTQGIEMFVENGWVKAKGTTLGADNGLGVAAIMSVLASDTVEHPNIEALFTIDEETGMTGAQGLQPGYLNGEILLNLDTEEDDEIDIGCAGGVDVTATGIYSHTELNSSFEGFEIRISGLQGGHSGMDIDKGLGNANKLMNGFLKKVADLIEINSIHGGGLRNAIPRESEAIILCVKENVKAFQSAFSNYETEIKSEYAEKEPELAFSLNAIESPLRAMDKGSKLKLITSIDEAINGVYKMSDEIPGLVEASNNIAKVLVDQGDIQILCLTRSSVEKTKEEVADQLRTSFEKAGFGVKLSGSYPGWSPNRDSPILKVLTDLYEQLFKSKPEVVACHAGLECGILGTHYPDMDMISFGPTIKGAHSPDERANIASSQRFWNFLQEILKNIPVRN